ncbi:MAG: hypothetical protein AAGI72_08315 [Pseudomonadota bacterium]
MLPTTLIRRILLPLLLMLPAMAWSDELSELRARNAQLEATVEELTLQLADALKERRRLEASLAEAKTSLAAAEASLTTTDAAMATAPAAMAAGGDGQAAAAVIAPEEARMVEEEIVSVADAAVTARSDAMSVASALDTTGCSVTEALAGYDGKRAGNEALTSWLKSGNHLNVCSTEQLEEIRAAIKWDWLGYQKEAIRMLDKELEARR